MDITPVIQEGKKTIDSYGKDLFRVSGEVHNNSIIIYEEIVINWQHNNIITEFDFDQVFALTPKPEILLLGMGNKPTFPAPKIRERFKKENIALEVMDSGAACRTYNILLAEGRKIAAAIIPIS